MENPRQIEIWFFIGSLLLAYGILISGAGIVHLFSPPEGPVALADLHADLWWGALLFIIGLVYCIRYWPFKRSHGPRNAER